MYFRFGHLRVRLAYLDNLLEIEELHLRKEEIINEIRTVERLVNSGLDTLMRNKRG